MSRVLTQDCVALQAFAERQRTNAPKPLDRRKLEPRIKEYIRETVRNLIEKKTAA